MASEVKDIADACPTEDFLAALFEYLVDPKLPGKSSSKGTPSQLEQESVAKQVHAVVLLYNHYHRKQHQQLEFLCFENFCKLAVIVRPALMAHTQLMQRSNGTESGLSLMEERIMEACEICMSLDASEDDLNIDGWPVSKVAVLLVDSRKENCVLQFGSITEGVWSVIEKYVDFSNENSDDDMDSNHVYKRKRIAKKPLKVKLDTREAGFQQIALLAVKEATGIDQSDLMVLERHVTYSMSREKTAAYFYIMQFSKTDNSDSFQTQIKDVINSLQGPLVVKNSNWWTHTSVVEYFHLLPYASILSDWFSRGGISNDVQVKRVGSGSMKINHADTAESNYESAPERFHNRVSGEITELPGSKATSGSLQHDTNKHLHSKMDCNLAEQNDNDGLCAVGLSDDNDRPRKVDVDASSVVHSRSKEKRKNFSSKNQPEKFQSKTVEKCVKGSASDDKVKADMVDQNMSQKITESRGAIVTNGNRNHNNNNVAGDQDRISVTRDHNNLAGDQDRVSITDHSMVTKEPNSKDLDKLSIIASKDKEMSCAVLRVLLSKRDKLCLQQREIEDQIAQCDKNIKTVLTGGEENLALKIESLIEGCKEIRIRSVSHERDGEDQCSPPSVKRKRLSGVMLNMTNSCQELDYVCYENDWLLPTYRVSPQDGGFEANVTLKGADFEYSSGGDLRPRPHEARESAASRMLAKLCNESANA